jgi:hypothetical protein
MLLDLVSQAYRRRALLRVQAIGLRAASGVTLPASQSRRHFVQASGRKAFPGMPQPGSNGSRDRNACFGASEIHPIARDAGVPKAGSALGDSILRGETPPGGKLGFAMRKQPAEIGSSGVCCAEPIRKVRIWRNPFLPINDSRKLSKSFWIACWGQVWAAAPNTIEPSRFGASAPMRWDARLVVTSSTQGERSSRSWRASVQLTAAQGNGCSPPANPPFLPPPPLKPQQGPLVATACSPGQRSDR